MHEVPSLERALVAFHDQERVPGQHEEVFLIRLPVVHRHWLAGPEDDDVDPQLLEEGLTLEVAQCRTPVGVVPACVLRVQNEPAVPARNPPALRLVHRRFGKHRPSLKRDATGQPRGEDARAALCPDAAGLASGLSPTRMVAGEVTGKELECMDR
jgi:hypothetical protein